MKQKQMQAVPLSRRRKLLQLTPGQIAGKLVVYGFLLFIFIVTFFLSGRFLYSPSMMPETHSKEVCFSGPGN